MRLSLIAGSFQLGAVIGGTNISSVFGFYATEGYMNSDEVKELVLDRT